jgi:DNA-binding beta-propeller fold protein YncE
MEDRRFDTLARRLGEAVPRRPLIAAVAATVFAALESPQVALACKKVGKKCDKTKDCCNHAKCKGKKCKCKSGYTKCGGKCFDLDQDEEHCGTCDIACPASETCVDGRCSEGGYVFVTEWGRVGSGDGEFNAPKGIAVTASGHVYVAEPWNSRIQIFTDDGGALGTWTGIDFPYGVAITSSEDVYICGLDNRLQRWNSGGMFAWSVGASGSGDGEFNNPLGIAVDGNGNAYVADTGNDRIQQFSADGDHLLSFGQHGIQDGEFDSPWGIAVTAAGHILVTDTGNSRVQEFDTDGNFLTTFGNSGNEALVQPTGVAVANDGSILVVDSASSRVKRFDANGDFVAAFGSEADGGGPGQFFFPSGIAIDPDGNLYVSDTENYRIQKFAPV